MSSIEFKITKDTLTPFLQEIRDTIPDKKMRLLADTGVKALREAQQLAVERLKKPGTYLQSFVVEVTANQMKLKNIHHAAAIIEFGTSKKGYRIPRTGEGLWFFKEGTWKWRPFVIHPGLDAKLIITDTMKKINPDLLKGMKELVGCV